MGKVRGEVIIQPAGSDSIRETQVKSIQLIPTQSFRYPLVTGGATPGKPVNHVLPASDIACAYQAAFAVLAAVDRRRRSGEGAELRIALVDIAFAMLSHLGVTAETKLLDQERPSIGNHLYGAFGRDFGTPDGEHLMVAAISANQWAALVKACAVEREISALEASTGLDFSRESERFEARDAIAALLAPWFAARALREVARTLDTHRVCWGQNRNVRELLAHEARVSLANPIFEQIDTPGVWSHMTAGSPVRVSGSARAPMRPAPLLGADTDEVLQLVLGLDSGAIGRLHDAGVVAGPERDPSVASKR
jgi:2-methylfumaryl-CoA isomerase